MGVTCLSQDIIAHETAHAILHSMRSRSVEATNPDSLAFHEAFADIIARQGSDCLWQIKCGFRHRQHVLSCAKCRRQIERAQHSGIFRYHQRVFQRIVQFADIARPIAPLQFGNGAIFDPGDRTALFRGAAARQQFPCRCPFRY